MLDYLIKEHVLSINVSTCRFHETTVRLNLMLMAQLFPKFISNWNI